MAKPSVYRQVEATAVGKYRLKLSPRHWNNGLFRYKGRLWMTYRYHMDEPGARCQTAITEISPIDFQPVSDNSQQLALPGSPTDHHEDARLFTYKGEPYVSYTQMTGYRPGVDFTCVMRYAKLKLTGKKWSVVQVFQPQYGQNNGSAKEKNWVFFEADGKLLCVYSGSPKHVVLELRGDRVAAVHESDGAVWPWGTMRGGTPPIPFGKDRFLSIFHSSLATEQPPAFVRYYGAAYTFSSKAPYAPMEISQRPLLAGSEEDGHQVDPRYVAGWKPYVVFPCGLVEDGEKYLVSFGVNDWQSAIASIPKDKLGLWPADGSFKKKRYFQRENGSMPIEFITHDMQRRYIAWDVPSAGPAGSAGIGYICVSDPREAEEIREAPGVTEISEAEFHNALMRRSNPSLMVR